MNTFWHRSADASGGRRCWGSGFIERLGRPLKREAAYVAEGKARFAAERARMKFFELEWPHSALPALFMKIIQNPH